jgi:dGTPase
VIVGREEIQRQEAATLAQYAVHSADSRGRRYPEPEDPYRTAFQRDRDRIIHCSAYRRLGQKTQVLIALDGDPPLGIGNGQPLQDWASGHYRTRLTHTEEATQVAVSIARALGANVDLTEAIARAHDLGHAPFGHAGEEALAAKMAAHGGFEHNLQTLRVVDELEEEYPDFRGLNLTAEVRAGTLAHRGDGAGIEDLPGAAPQPSVEAQIADIADEIAYCCHDLQDGLAAGLLRRDDIARRCLPWWSEARAAIASRWGALAPDLEQRRIKGYLINRFTSDLITSSAERLAGSSALTAEAIRQLPERVIDFSPPVRALRDSLHAYLSTYLYQHPEVVTMEDRAKRLLGELFDAYDAHPAHRPAALRARVPSAPSVERVICDHIASMTDRSAVREHHRITRRQATGGRRQRAMALDILPG